MGPRQSLSLDHLGRWPRRPAHVATARAGTMQRVEAEGATAVDFEMTRSARLLRVATAALEVRAGMKIAPESEIPRPERRRERSRQQPTLTPTPTLHRVPARRHLAARRRTHPQNRR